jgi:hypothetical protein
MRLKSGLWASAYVRHCNVEGVFAAVRRRGADEAGAIFIKVLNTAVVEALADPAAHSRLAELGYEVFSRERQTPEALAGLQKADADKWWPIIKSWGSRQSCCNGTREPKVVTSMFAIRELV